MKNNESVFNKFHSSVITKIKNNVNNISNVELVYNTPYILVYKANHLNDVLEFPNINKLKNVNDIKSLFDTAQFYVIYDIYNHPDGLPAVAITYPNRSVKIVENRDDFAKLDDSLKKLINLDIFKPKSADELAKLPVDSLIRAHFNNKLDLGTLNFKMLFKVIKKEPSLIKEVNLKSLTTSQIKKLSKINNIEQHLSNTQMILFKKGLRTKDEIKYDNSTEIYVFLAREKFVENENGTYIKDYEIESLNKVDKYNKNDLYVISMLKMRERIQNDVKLYMLNSQKGLIKSMLGTNLYKINEDEYRWLRKVIIEKSKRI